MYPNPDQIEIFVIYLTHSQDIVQHKIDISHELAQIKNNDHQIQIH